MNLMRQLAAESQVELPLADIIEQHLTEAKAEGKGDLDWGAIGELMREKAGLA